MCCKELGTFKGEIFTERIQILPKSNWEGGATTATTATEKKGRGEGGEGKGRGEERERTGNQEPNESRTEQGKREGTEREQGTTYIHKHTHKHT